MKSWQQRIVLKTYLRRRRARRKERKLHLFQRLPLKTYLKTYPRKWHPVQQRLPIRKYRFQERWLMGQATVSSSSLSVAVQKVLIAMFLCVYICCDFFVAAHLLIQHRCRIATYMSAMKVVTCWSSPWKRLKPHLLAIWWLSNRWWLTCFNWTTSAVDMCLITHLNWRRRWLD